MFCIIIFTKKVTMFDINRNATLWLDSYLLHCAKILLISKRYICYNSICISHYTKRCFKNFRAFLVRQTIRKYILKSIKKSKNIWNIYINIIFISKTSVLALNLISNVKNGNKITQTKLLVYSFYFYSLEVKCCYKITICWNL